MSWKTWLEATQGHWDDIQNALNGLQDGAVSIDEAAEALAHIELPTYKDDPWGAADTDA